MHGPTIGVDIGGTKALLVAAWPDKRPPDVLQLDTGPEMNPDNLEHYITRFAASLGAEPWALGIAVPGLVDADQVLFCDVLPLLDGWQPRNLLGAHVPQVMDNDVNAALAGETLFLPPRASAVLLVVGTGIGMAAVDGGRVVNGVRGWAGELGRIPMITPAGIRQLDEIASGAAILSHTGLGAEEVHTALATGDPRIHEVIRQAGETLGLAIATVIDLLNPEVLTLAGGTLRYPGYLTEALTTAEQTAAPHLWRACAVRRATDEALIVARGAIRLARGLRSAGAAASFSGIS